MQYKNVYIYFLCPCVFCCYATASPGEPAKATNMLLTTEYPTVHFFLNLVGTASIIKGAAWQLFPEFAITVDKTPNFTRLGIGLGLILFSQICRFIERWQHKQIFKTNMTRQKQDYRSC